MTGAGPDVAEAMFTLGLAPTDLNRVVRTHFHDDHADADADADARSAVTVMAHRRDASIIRGQLSGPPPALTDDECGLLASVVGGGLPSAPRRRGPVAGRS